MSGIAIPDDLLPAAVECRGVVRDFGEGDVQTRVLHGIDLDVRQGETTLLVGPSGCGKTTLISIICGLLEPTAGAIRLFGVERASLPGRKLWNSVVRTSGSCFNNTICCPR